MDPGLIFAIVACLTVLTAFGFVELTKVLTTFLQPHPGTKPLEEAMFCMLLMFLTTILIAMVIDHCGPRKILRFMRNTALCVLSTVVTAGVYICIGYVKNWVDLAIFWSGIGTVGLIGWVFWYKGLVNDVVVFKAVTCFMGIVIVDAMAHFVRLLDAEAQRCLLMCTTSVSVAGFLMTYRYGWIRRYRAWVGSWFGHPAI